MLLKTSTTEKIILKYCNVIIIIASVFYALTLEHLIENGYNSPSVLVYRGIITFLITLILSIKSGQVLIPSKLSLQTIRIIVSGLALLMIIQSYRYLEASTVFMIARLDIPFAVIIGFALRKRGCDFKLILSLIAVLMAI